MGRETEKLRKDHDRRLRQLCCWDRMMDFANLPGWNIGLLCWMDSHVFADLRWEGNMQGIEIGGGFFWDWWRIFGFGLAFLLSGLGRLCWSCSF